VSNRSQSGRGALPEDVDRAAGAARRKSASLTMRGAARRCVVTGRPGQPAPAAGGGAGAARPAYGPANDAQLFANRVGLRRLPMGPTNDFQQAMGSATGGLRCWLDQNTVRALPRANGAAGRCAQARRIARWWVRVAGVPAFAARARCVELELVGHDLLDLSLDARLLRVLGGLQRAGSGTRRTRRSIRPGLRQTSRRPCRRNFAGWQRVRRFA